MKMDRNTKRVETSLLILATSAAVATILLFSIALTTGAWSNVVRLCFLTFALFVSSRILSRSPSAPTRSPWRPLTLALLGLVTLACLSAVLMRLEEIQRTIFDLLTLGTAWSLVLVQCLAVPTGRNNRIAILSESTVIALFSLFAVNMAYSGFNGHRDFLFHVQTSEGIMSTHAIQYASLYGYFPVLHLLTAQLAWITGLPVHMSLSLAVGLSMAATIPLVYEMGRSLTGNERVALVASVVFASSSEFVLWGGYAVPTALGFVFAFFAVFQVISPGFSLKRKGIALTFLGAVTLTHILAAALLVLILGSIALYPWVRRVLTGNRAHSEPRAFSFALISGVVVIGYWVYLAFGILSNYIALIRFALEPLPLSPPLQTTGPQVPIIAGLGTAIIASLYLISVLVFTFGWQRSALSKRGSIIVASLVFVLGLGPSIVASPIFGQDSYALQRWTLFGMPFVSLLVAGLSVLTQKTLWRKIIVVLLVVAIFSGVSSVAFDASSTLAGGQYGIPTDFFSDAELTADTFLVQHGHGPVVTDFIFSALLLYQYPTYSGGPISFSYSSFLDANGYLVVRTGELAQRGLRFVALTHGYESGVTVNAAAVAAQMQSMSVVYDNGRVDIAVRA